MDQPSPTGIDPASVFALSVIGVVAMLLLALAVVIFYVFYQRRLLDQQREMNALRERQQRSLLVATLAAEEAERHRIAAELHDGVGSLLSTGKLFLRQIPAPPAAAEHHQTALNLLDRTIDNVRAITQNLAPENLRRFGLVPALEDLVQTMNQLPDGPAVQLHADTDQRLPAAAESALYRIVQELLNNSLKYAEARTIEIELRLLPQSKRLSYRDDGKGTILEEGSDASSGYGLKNIRSRATVLPGEVRFVSRPGAGFRAELSFSTELLPAG